MTFREYYDQVWKPEGDKWTGKPHASIQWKGTDVCIDLRCPCGAQGHLDVDFLYHYECAACGAKYAVGCYVELIPLNAEQIAYVNSGSGFKFDTDLREEP